MTLSQQLRIRGFQRNLSVRGRAVRASTGEKLKVIIIDVPPLVDPDPIPQAEVQVYTNIFALRSDVVDPRAIADFTEINDDRSDGRKHQVIRYIETAEVVSLKWECEAQRK